MRTPEQVIADELAWIQAQAEALPKAARLAALDALSARHPPTVAISLYKLLDEGVLPQAWQAHVTNLFEFSR